MPNPFDPSLSSSFDDAFAERSPFPLHEGVAPFQETHLAVDQGPRLHPGALPAAVEQIDDLDNPFIDPDPPEDEAPAAPNLGAVLDTEFETNRHLHRVHEENWLRDLRQVKGKYDPKIQEKLDDNDNQCQTFIRLTKVKIRTVLSRMMDLLFPMSGQLNWDLEATPNADLPGHVIQEVAMKRAQELGGQMPDAVQLQHAVQAEAARRSTAMKMEIHDQLAESPGRVGYQATIRAVIKSALTYGTGVLKGPLVQRRDRKRWVQSFKLDMDGRHIPEWTIEAGEEDYQPYYEAVSVWDFYPDMSAVHLGQCRFVWQTHLKTRSELLELAGKDYFDSEVVRQYILDNPSGDAQMETHESDVRRIAEENIPADLKDRYRLKERWGMLTGKDLADAGMELDESEMHREFWSNVWLLGDKVIKAAVEPVRGVELPYYCYYYDKDETSIFGEGICADIRDPQSAFNAVIRKILDQYGISGPMFGVNMSALAPGEDPRDIHAHKVFLFEGAEDMQKAMQTYIVPAFTQEGMSMAAFLQNFADEVTAPRYMHGDQNVAGAGATASGLSMLMGAMNVNLKDLVKGFDDNLTTPFITAMYYWNMQFSEKEHIKGDFHAVAKGSTALVAKEVKAEKLVNASGLLANPNFAPWVREDEMLKELFQAMDVRPDLIRTEEEFQARQQMMTAMEAEANAKALLKETMNEMRARGLQPEQALHQILQQVAPAMMQQMGPPQGQPQGAGAPMPPRPRQGF